MTEILDLDELQSYLVSSALSGDPGSQFQITEGRVRTMDRPPYRRLDLGHMALAYVRVRRKKQAVLVDISGAWFVPQEAHSILRPERAATGLMFLVRSREDADRAAIGLRMIADHHKQKVQK